MRKFLNLIGSAYVLEKSGQFESKNNEIVCQVMVVN